MNWVKSNWLIIVLSVVALTAGPVMWFFSSKMSKDLRTKIDKDVKAASNDVTGSKVKYSVPDVQKPDTPAFEIDTDVNQILTEKFAKSRDAIKSQSALLGAEAVKFNEAGHRPLVEGLFPAPPTSERNRATNEFARAYIENHPQVMLDSVNARPPMDATRLGAELAEYKSAREQRAAAVGSAAMGAQELAKLNEELLNQRLDRYLAWANQTAFYADTNIYEDIETQVPNPVPPLSRLWDWQLRVWIYGDLMKAFELANANAAGGGEPNVLSGVVKRVIKMRTQGQDYQDTPDDQADSLLESQATPAKDPVAPDWSTSVTGRTGGPTSGNHFYDLRTATVELVVAPDKLPYLFDALAKVNFMTVLRCDMEPIEAEPGLREGYYYGDDHVVKATIHIETIWLRAWTKKYMPRTVRLALGIPDEKPAEEVPPQDPPQ